MVDIIIHTTKPVPEWHEQYGRMQRWYKKYKILNKDSEVVDSIDAQDIIYAFFQNCYHLKYWVKNDDSIDQKLKQGLEDAINNNEDMILCDCLANGTKHKVLTQNERRKKVESIKLKATINLTLVADNPDKSKGRYVWGVVVNEKETISGIDLAGRCMGFWQEYLKSELEKTQS